MTDIKGIVKIMNFHSLLRVDKSKRTAEKYFKVSEELDSMIVQLLYNRNLTLDKKVITANENGKVINIYLGNDLGFCGNFNSKVNKELKKDIDDDLKIVIGKKIHINNKQNVILEMSKEDFTGSGFNKVQQIINDTLINRTCKEINVIYNEYHNINNIEFVKKKLFPVEFSKKDINDSYDFVIETDVNKVIAKMVSLYICHQLKIMEQNSYASENVMRQQVTRESLKKIDELKEEKDKVIRKEEKYKKFQKQISNYRGNVGDENDR